MARRERDAELAASAGAGLDIIFRKQDGIRIQVDLIQRYTGEKKTHFRVSVGAIVRWHPPFLPDSPEHDELRTTPARPAPARPR